MKKAFIIPLLIHASVYTSAQRLPLHNTAEMEHKSSECPTSFIKSPGVVKAALATPPAPRLTSTQAQHTNPPAFSLGASLNQVLEKEIDDLNVTTFNLD